MSRNTIIGLVGLAVVVILGAWAYNAVLGEPEAATEPISAIPLEVDTPEAVEPTAPPATEEPAAEPATAEPTEAPAEPEATEEPVVAAAGGLKVFEIVPAESQARFELDEDLRGSRITVVGSTDQVAGQIALDFADLSTAQLGVIQVNARALVTDNNFRNRAIKNQILLTDQHEFVTFVPQSISGLPATVTAGESVTFEVSGDLSITNITQPATFVITATVTGDGEIAGTASTVVQRADYDLIIPSVPNVANVEEEVEIYLDFVARAQG